MAKIRVIKKNDDYSMDYQVGDIMEFDVNYATMIYLTNCRNVHIAFV